MDEEGAARVSRLEAWIKKNRRDLLSEAGDVAPARMSEVTGRRVSYWSDVFRRRKSFGSKAARDVETRLEIKPTLYLDGLDIGQHSSRGVAQKTILPSHTVAASLDWGAIVGSQKLPQQFTTTVPDDAMLRHVRAGTECVFRTDRRPKFGDGVLVVDKHQQLHLRLYAQGDRPGHWLAKADNTQAFREMDSEADGLTVVAVFHGALKGWGE